MSKTFKDFVMEDLNVFFNETEFAEEHELDGDVLLCVVVDTDLRDDATGFSQNHEYATQDVFQRKKTVYIKADDFYVPRIGAVLTLDNEEFYVDEANDQRGVIRIVLRINES